MDELPGILARDFGIRPQGKSAPMAASKAASARSFRSSSAGSSWNMPRSGLNPTSAGDSFLGDDGFGMWGSRSQPAYDDLCGGPPSYPSASSSPSAFDSLFEGYKVSGTKSSSLPMNAKPVHVDDIFDGFPGSKISSVKHVDVFSSFSPGFNHVSTPPYGDLLENLGKPMPEPKSAKKEGLTGFDELIPGFGGNSPPNKREPPGTKQKPSVSSAKPTTCVAEDPFVVLETASTSTNSAPALFVDPLEHINRPLSSKGKKVNASSISRVAFVEINSFDGFSKSVPSSTMGINETEKEKSFVNDFHKASVEHQFSGGGHAQRSSVDAFESIFPEMHPTKSSAAATAAREKQQTPENDLESFFSMGARASSAPKQRTSPETMFNVKAQKMGGRDGIKRTSSGFTSTIRKASSTTNIADDLSFIFGGPPSSGEFQEIEGESEERRRARLDRHRRTLDRAAKALAEKNERDMQIQQEQAERHRISEALDIEIKCWAAGKEGNLRALLSSLQYVLWPECGWQPVSLTDLITAAAVKKVHRKATLCIHPDKMQQKGATLQQKYIAEKVFDILKEAWNKFNSEELR